MSFCVLSVIESAYCALCSRGEDIFISVWNIHRDPNSWDRADEFVPERWPLDGPDPNEVSEGFRYATSGLKTLLWELARILQPASYYPHVLSRKVFHTKGHPSFSGALPWHGHSDLFPHAWYVFCSRSFRFGALPLDCAAICRSAEALASVLVICSQRLRYFLYACVKQPEGVVCM